MPLKENKWTCKICECEYDFDGGIERHEADSGNGVCGGCLDHVIIYSTSTASEGEQYGDADYEERSVIGLVCNTKSAAIADVKKMAVQQWGSDVEMVLKD